MRIYSRGFPGQGRQTTVGLSSTAIFSVFAGHIQWCDQDACTKISDIRPRYQVLTPDDKTQTKTSGLKTKTRDQDTKWIVLNGEFVSVFLSTIPTFSSMDARKICRCVTAFSEIYISQGNVAMRLRCGGNFNNYRTLLQIFWRVCQWKNRWRLINIYLRQVNEVNGGDNAFVRCVSVCLSLCAQRPVNGS